jgi:hypothetical protein
MEWAIARSLPQSLLYLPHMTRLMPSDHASNAITISNRRKTPPFYARLSVLRLHRRMPEPAGVTQRRVVLHGTLRQVPDLETWGTLGSQGTVAGSSMDRLPFSSGVLGLWRTFCTHQMTECWR